MADVFCSQDVDTYTQVDCGIDQAGIVAVAYIDTDTATPTKENLETEAWWTALLEASPAGVHIVTKTRGEYPGGTPTEEEGFGRESNQITGANHEANTEFEGIEENRDFVEGINRRKWKVAFITNGNKGIYIDSPVTVYGKLNVPRGITTAAFWMINHKWQSYSNPVVFEIPDNIFDE
jgi:hypothetical protein